MQWIVTNRFRKDYRALDRQIQIKVDSAIVTLVDNRFYPGLKTKKVKGVSHHWQNDIWEARVDGEFRITYHIDGDAIVLRRCGTHSIYDNP